MALFISQLATGDAIFLDANVLVYHFQPHPLHGAACHELFSRIDQQDLTNLASADADFDRVPGIKRYAPAQPVEPVRSVK